MRLITRSDFDGLACAALLKKAGIIDEMKFAHPKDLQDGLVEVGPNDCLANVPYVPGCGIWFDHHSSELDRVGLVGEFVGESRLAPSCCRIIYEYYGGAEKFPGFEDMMIAVDKVDSADLTIDEIQNPKDWILLGFLMDPRTGLGRWRDFTISNYALMEKLIDACMEMPIEDILALSDVKERVDVYWEQNEKFMEMISKYTHTEGDVIISDLRGVEPIYSGNRFLIYSIYTHQNISCWIVSGKGGKGCSCAVGYSVLNKTSTVDVGKLMYKYGGGGHKAVGTCQFSEDEMEEKIKSLLEELVNHKN